MKKTGRTWRRGAYIAGLAAAGIFLMSGQKADAATEPEIVGQEAVIYMDGMDKISVEGQGIQSISYSSSKKKVAKIDDNGKIIPKKKGKTKIQAKVTYRLAGQNNTKLLSYDLRVMAKSTEYFKYNGKKKKYSKIVGLTKKGKKLKKVYIPGYCKGQKVLYVDRDAFRNDVALEKLYTSDNLIYLDYFEWSDGYEPEENFSGCKNLKELYLGKNIYGVGYQSKNTSLEKITVDSRNSKFLVRDNVLFTKYGKLVYYPGGRNDKEYKIPQGVTSVERFAFSGVKKLQKIQLPEGIEEISQAFHESGLTEVTIPESVESFYGAFLNCNALEKVVVKTKFSGESAFEGCRKLKTVVLSGTISGSSFGGCYSLENIQLSPQATDVILKEGVLFSKDGKKLFVYPPGKRANSYVLPAGTQEIGENAFVSAQFLSELITNKELTVIGEHAFDRANITRMILNEGVKKIEDCAFENLKVTEMNLPDSVVTLGWGAFYKCKMLQSVKLSQNMEQIPGGIFIGCSALEKIHIPAKVKKIDGEPFTSSFSFTEGCKSLKAYTVDKGNKNFTAVNGVLFDKSKKILYSYPAKKKGKKFVLPKSVIRIRGNAFRDNYYLQEISMRDKVRFCEENVFQNARSLKKVRLSKNLKEIGMCAFEGCKKLRKITIPDSVRTLGFSAFQGCTRLEEVTIGKKLEYLQSYTFKNCKNLKKLVFRGKRRALYYSGALHFDNDTFVKTGSNHYKKLVVKIQSSKKQERNQIKIQFYQAGLNKKSKILFGK